MWGVIIACGVGDRKRAAARFCEWAWRLLMGGGVCVAGVSEDQPWVIGFESFCENSAGE